MSTTWGSRAVLVAIASLVFATGCNRVLGIHPFLPAEADAGAGGDNGNPRRPW